MKWLVDLLSTDHGLFNTGVIVRMLGVRVGCSCFFSRKVDQAKRLPR